MIIIIHRYNTDIFFLSILKFSNYSVFQLRERLIEKTPPQPIKKTQKGTATSSVKTEDLNNYTFNMAI